MPFLAGYRLGLNEQGYAVRDGAVLAPDSASGPGERPRLGRLRGGWRRIEPVALEHRRGFRRLQIFQ